MNKESKAEIESQIGRKLTKEEIREYNLLQRSRRHPIDRLTPKHASIVRAIVAAVEAPPDYLNDLPTVEEQRAARIPETPRIAELENALRWIAQMAKVNYENDPKLRSNAARALKRIAEKADEALDAPRRVGNPYDAPTPG